MKRWKYLLIILRSGNVTTDMDEINVWGGLGWELVSVTPESDDYASVAYFKKETTDETKPE